ncbi:hypothetical protein, partial [Paracoccus sp. IB05]|uniref:hypothetical protein n=1 Tax=Paracoccus sp. IB05 TaxID=2779367 RepID=UPI0018E869B8
MFRNISRGLIEGQPINPRRDERPHFWIAVNLRGTSWSMPAAVCTDRRCGFWQGIQSLLKAGFNGSFRGRECQSVLKADPLSARNIDPTRRSAI